MVPSVFFALRIKIESILKTQSGVLIAKASETRYGIGLSPESAGDSSCDGPRHIFDEKLSRCLSSFRCFSYFFLEEESVLLQE